MEPKPKPEPRPKPKPRPKPRPKLKPEPRPKPKPMPEPRPRPEPCSLIYPEPSSKQLPVPYPGFFPGHGIPPFLGSDQNEEDHVKIPIGINNLFDQNDAPSNPHYNYVSENNGQTSPCMEIKEFPFF